MAEFEYIEPETMAEAVSLISRYKGLARIIAGGTDLVLQIKKSSKLPEYIINIRGIPGQDFISYDEKEGVSIGARATISSIAAAPVIRQKYCALAEAASQLGTPTIRNTATIGGNICNAAPSAETAPALIVFGAMARIISADGIRMVPIEEFFTGPGQTVCRSDEILVEIRIPAPPRSYGSTYLRQTVRNSLDLAIAGVAVLVKIEDDIIQDVRIALGSVAPTPIRAKDAEEIIRGKRLDTALLDKAGLAAASEARPIDDVRSSAAYRRKIVQVLVKRAISQAMAQVKTN